MVHRKTWFSEKFWQDLEISEAFLISLEVSFFHGLFLLFLSLETFHQRVSGSDFYNQDLGISASLGFYHSPPLIMFFKRN